MEYYFPEDINISLLAEASTAIINKQTITNFPSYKKQLVQINQQTKDTPDYLFFTIRGSGTTATNPEGYLVFYGVKEWVDTVPSEIYDHVLETGMFEYDNGNMKLYHDIDMDNHRIKNIAPPTNPTDLLMKKSIKIYEMPIFGIIDKNRYFSVNGVIAKFHFVYIVSVNIIDLGSSEINDNLIIVTRSVLGHPSHRGRIYKYNFSYSSPNPLIRIYINREFINITSISLEKGANMACYINFSPIFFNTT